jgi:apolipoprotein D and lipocalin family protein
MKALPHRPACGFMQRLGLATGAVILLQAAMPALAQEVRTAASVDLPRYLGRWYEIAKFPNSFQKQCVRETTADYRVIEDGKIEVANRCKTAAGVFEVAVGEVKVIDKATNAKLQVRFAPSWLSWLPMVWGDYWILERDDAYAVATVGSPDRDHLWILARTPKLSNAVYENLVDNATKQGFDTAKLVKTPQ